MPGIAGVLAPTPSPAHEPIVRRMVAVMRHSPDLESGTLFAPDLGVYAGWVSHGGSFAARLNAAVAPARLLLNGECFHLGVRPETALAQTLAERGEDLLADLNGLFAGLLVDHTRRCALLFNDRFGSERLYTYHKDGATYFSSEAKALLAVLPELRAFDETGVAQFLAFGSTIGGHTLFRGMRLMPGGSIWRHEPGLPPRRSIYFSPQQWEQLQPLPSDEAQARFAAVFKQLLPAYSAADAPVGLSLTGGLDTRMILACLRCDRMPQLAYTYAAAGGDRLLDLTIAQRVAQHCAIPHHPLRVDPQFLMTFPQQLDRTVFVTDGTAGVLGAHEIYLSEQARRLAPVRLTGNYGSEVLRSMSTFKRNGPDDHLLEPALAARVHAVVDEQRARSVHPVTHAAFEEVPWHLFGTMAASRSLLSVRTPYLDNQIVELAYRMPEPLRQSPDPALQLVHDNDPTLAAIATDRGLAWRATGPLALLRRLYGTVTFKLDYWHKDGLPNALSPFEPWIGALTGVGLLGLHKFLSYRTWFRHELAAYAQQVTQDARTRALPFWNRDTLRTIASEHSSGRANRLRELHAVLTLEAVHRLLIDEAAHLRVSPTA